MITDNNLYLGACMGICTFIQMREVELGQSRSPPSPSLMLPLEEQTLSQLSYCWILLPAASLLALVCAFSALISSLCGEETMQAKAWLSHWIGCERCGSWLTSDLAEASMGKQKEEQIFIAFSCSVHIDQDHTMPIAFL